MSNSPQLPNQPPNQGSDDQPSNQGGTDQPPNQDSGIGKFWKFITGEFDRLAKLTRDSIFVFFVVGILAALFLDIPVLSRLSDPAFARGLITFLISISVIGLAFILVYSANEAKEDVFRRSREIFTGLVAVLGTIVGFYFGSVDRANIPLEVARIQFSDKQLLTYVSGGSRPYRYVIESNDKDFDEIQQLSQDGWIIESLESLPKSGTTLTVKVIDAQKKEATTRIDFPVQPKSESSATTSESNPTQSNPTLSPDSKLDEVSP